ncbi:biotin/lipoyl-binding protein [Tabrizicola sp. J26]|uniref:HlyD family secretion protein n=1 Tax=Alitabrizicola rongguiensis TaxID=2909234 RepID=UPI001F1EB371|nr:biotin/lipoyl-binding protein [Tabrizicola rongguiensis]MCF1710887.1 biotin/lipoyl-binding protein [Tabrizicola rongguiensis]
MLELLFCSALTILPDFLFRRYRQGRRIGYEITLYSVWYELRYGIVACVFLTVSLITTIFYFHPATSAAVAMYRTVPIVPEGIGRVSEVYVWLNEKVEAGQPLFRLDDSEQKAAVATAEAKVDEVRAALAVATSQIALTDARIIEARSALKQAEDERDTKAEIRRRNPDAVAPREIERLQNVVDGRAGGLKAAEAEKVTLATQIETQLPAELRTAEAALAQAQADLDKTVIRAGVAGEVQQFTLRVGDLVNPMMRPAGVLVPAEAGREAIQAGFGQIEANVMRPGMAAEIACIARPFTIIPMVVTEVQSTVSSGQVRGSDQLFDPVQAAQVPGTIVAYLQPMFEGGLDGIPPGSVCTANAYTSYHEQLKDPNLGTFQRIGMHVVDTVGLVHALILRMQAVVAPVQVLVFSGGH